VKKVEDVESKCCRRPVNCCREPASTKKLDMSSGGIDTIAITDDEAVGTRQIEDHEVSKTRGTGTIVTNLVSDLDNETEGSEGGVFEETTIPDLGRMRTSRP